MNDQFEYRSTYFHGLADDEETPATEDIAQLLKERGRAYNRLGAEGWALVAEHMIGPGLACIATFRRTTGHTAMTESAGAEGEPAPPPAATGTPAYPVLQPDPSAPGSFRLVWDQ